MTKKFITTKIGCGCNIKSDFDKAKTKLCKQHGKLVGDELSVHLLELQEEHAKEWVEDE
jgi:hypothetical protein